MGAAATRPLPSTSARGGRRGVTPTTDEPAAGPETAEPETAEPEIAEPEIAEPAPPSAATTLWLSVLRIIGSVAIPIAGFFALWATFDFLRDTEANRSLVVLVAVVVGVGGIFFLFWAMNRVVGYLPARFREGVRPYIFVGPCLVILSVFLIYPVINTIIISFKDATSSKFVGFDNFKFVFTDSGMLTAIRNTAGWIILVPLVATAIGLGFATLADRLRRGEAVAKSLIFLPMAISFAGASIVWNFIYSFRPQGFGTNIGLHPDHDHHQQHVVPRWLGQQGDRVLGQPDHDPVQQAERDHDRAGPAPGRLAGPATVEQRVADGDHGLDADRLRHGGPVRGDQGRSRRDHRGRPHRRRLRAAGVPADHRAHDPPHDRGGGHLHGHQRHEGVRHRLRHGECRGPGDRGHRRTHDRVVLRQG